MDSQRVLQAAGVLAILVVATAYAFQTCVITVPFGTDREAATVQVVSSDGERLATVDARVADTRCQRYEGLSGTESLADGAGILFVHDSEQQLTYVMRGMNYGLDMIFVDADGRVTAVRSAPPPAPGEDGNDIRRSARGQYVLEVPRGYAAANGIEPGDRIEIEYRD